MAGFGASAGQLCQPVESAGVSGAPVVEVDVVLPDDLVKSGASVSFPAFISTSSITAATAMTPPTSQPSDFFFAPV